MDSNVFKKAALIAAACTTVQAIIWFALSLVGLLTAVDVIKEPGYSILLSKPSEAFPYYLVKCFFSDKDDLCCTNLVTRGSGMLAISAVYMIMSLAWLCSSTMLIFDLLKEEKHLSALTKTWAGSTILVCVLDLVVAVLFGVDYAKMERRKYTILLEESYSCGSIHLEVSGFLMSLAARGYVLWILNLVVAIWLLRTTTTSARRSSSRRCSEVSDDYRAPLDAITRDSPNIFPKRPWMDKEKLAASQAPSIATSDDTASVGGARLHPDTPSYGQINPQRDTHRGVQPQSPLHGPLTPTSPSSPRQFQPPSHPPPQSPSGYPAPQYGRSGIPPRSVLKKPPPPPSTSPTPGTPTSPSSVGSCHQQVQQPNNWQQSAGDNVRRPQSYDNRGYDRGY